DYDLSTFPAIRTWLRRVEQIPGFVPMDWQPAETTSGMVAQA
ncbi:MAG TPA: glutathione S-transferase family protein, partial [Bradyrhizobium sp.]|nr:glutathione S-transferase family protein [Bradyrhizobium sp.]